VGLVHAIEITAPAGVFFVRIRALTIGGAGPASNEVVVAVGPAAAPGAPSNLLADIDGSTLRLAWRNADAGGDVVAIQLEAFTVTAAPLATLPLAPGTEWFVAAVPPGAYMIRMRAIGPTLVSGPSNGVVVTVPAACGIPATPEGFSAAASGGNVTLSWRLGPVGSPAPSAFLLEARTTGGALIGAVPLVGHELRTPAPPGTYVLRLLATSPCGTSTPTPDVTLVVQ
jgi:hypothetical protein